MEIIQGYYSVEKVLHLVLKLWRKIISFIHISLDGFAAEPNGEMNRINVDEEIFDHVGKRVNKKMITK